MASALLLTLREGFEASLIASITMAYLKRTGNDSLIRYVWLAIAAAAVVTTAAGTALFVTKGEFEGRAEQLFEGTVMVVAALVITHVWRRFQNLRRTTERKTGQLVGGNDVSRGIFAAAFIAVLIEGMEIVLFLLASVNESTADVILGAAIGLALAAFAGWLFYQTSRMSDAILFFYSLSAILMIIAAGLLARGVGEFQEAGVLQTFVEHVWDVNNVPIIGDSAGFGRFMKSAVGYNSNPSLLQVTVWVAYIGTATWYFNLRGFMGMLGSRIRGGFQAA